MREGWVKRKLGDVFTLEYGKPLPKDQRCEETGFPAYGANGIKCYAVKPYREGPSIIVGRKGTAGAVNLVESAFWPLDVTYYVTFDNSEYDLRFLYYVLSSLDLPSLATGVKPGINRNIVYSIERAFPPLVEQKRIVAILDEAFAGIDAAIANTEKNLANARELFESYLNSVFCNERKGWFQTNLGEQIELLTGFAFKSKAYTQDLEGVPLLRGDNVIQGVLRWKGVKRWPTDDVRNYEKYLLSEGDVVLAMDRTWVKAGIKCAKIEKSDLPCLLVQRVARLRVKKSLNSEYLRFLIGSKIFENYVLSIQTGLGVPHISGKQIINFRFYLPPIEDQGQIVSILGELNQSIQSLEAIYDQKLSALSELKQSLLQKAFTGELTAENMESEAREAMV